MHSFQDFSQRPRTRSAQRSAVMGSNKIITGILLKLLSELYSNQPKNTDNQFENQLKYKRKHKENPVAKINRTTLCLSLTSIRSVDLTTPNPNFRIKKILANNPAQKQTNKIIAEKIPPLIDRGTCQKTDNNIFSKE
ncbi:hypothetical protein ACFL96_15205 [Thermoproteota archaeon]